MGRKEEVAQKKERVLAYMKKQGLGAVLLGSTAGFAWYTAGGQNHVSTASEKGVARVLVTPERDYLLANNIEMPRLLAEEVPEGLFEVIEHPWFDEGFAVEALGKVMPLDGIASDDAFGGTSQLPSDFVELRYSLIPDEVVRYKWLGRHVSEVLEAACALMKAGMTELRVAGQISRLCYGFGIIPVVVLVAADERISRFRHPIPTEKEVERCAMLVLCGKKGGLICSATRLVHLGPVPEELKRKHRAVCEVDATFILGTVEGADVGELFRRAQETYTRHGYPDEWKLHHQGGATGYATRDFKVTGSTKRKVLKNQAFAWNPSITGTKSEGTIVATDDGPEIITAAIAAPTISIEVGGEVIHRPAIWER